MLELCSTLCVEVNTQTLLTSSVRYPIFMRLYCRNASVVWNPIAITLRRSFIALNAAKSDIRLECLQLRHGAVRYT